MHSIDHAVEDTEIWIKSIHYMYDSELGQWINLTELDDNPDYGLLDIPNIPIIDTDTLRDKMLDYYNEANNG
jgi:hypothetical protein